MFSISLELSGIIEGFEKTPIARAEVFDTTYTVPSSGFFVQYYSGIDLTDSSAIKRTQFESKIYNDWSNGIPVELSHYLGTQAFQSGLIGSDPFAVVYSGWFYADTAGTYNFGTRSTGGTQIYLDGNPVLTGVQALTPFVDGYSTGIWAGKDMAWNGDTTLTTGWHPFRLDFLWQTLANSGNIGRPMLTAFYDHPDPATPSRVLTASAVNTHPEFIQPTNINNLMRVGESLDEDAAGQYTFEVSIQPTGLYQWNQARQDFGALKTNRLINVFMGYATQSGYAVSSGYTTNLSATEDIDMPKKFTGLIDSVNVSETPDSITADVRCRDFNKKLINKINENLPNRASYLPEIVSTVDPYGIFDIDRVMPLAYDNWILFDVVQDLCLHSDIDPVHLERSKWDTQNFFKLESNLNWPSTTTSDINGVQTVDGDPFIFTFEYGEKNYDLVKRVVDLVGYRVGFDRSGDLVVKEPRATNRVEIYETGNVGSKAVTYSSDSDWSLGININASNRFYKTPVVSGSYTSGYVDLAFSGVGMGLWYTAYPLGSGYTVDITRDSDSANVYSQTFDSATISATGWATNRVMTRDLPYDGYTARVSGFGALRVEGFEYYTSNAFKPVYNLLDSGDIGSLTIDLNDDAVRNEIITIGQQTGDKAYKYSKAIDLDSISNPDSFNYVGEKKTTTIIEPTIQSQNRLDWLSSAILERFRRKQRNITVKAQGIPHLEVGDPVGIDSSRLGMASTAITGFNINNEEVFYVRKINSTLKKGSYTTNLTLTSLKPIESWRPPVSITTDLLREIYRVNNNTIFQNYRQLTLNHPDGLYGYDGFSEQAAFVGFDLLVDVDRLWVLVGDAQDGGELFKNIDVKLPSPIAEYQSGKGLTDEDPPQGGVWLHNGGGERWGNIVVPTAQNDFNGGQWAGQNSESKIRQDGKYPIAIWAQFRTSDQATYYQGIWVPPSGTIDNRDRTLSNTTPTSSDVNLFYAYTYSPQQGFVITPTTTGAKEAYLPAFSVALERLKTNLWIGPIESGYQMVGDNKLLDMSSNFDHHGDLWSSPIAFDSQKRKGEIPSLKTPTWSNYVANGANFPATDQLWKVGDDILGDGDSNVSTTQAISVAYYANDVMVHGTKSRATPVARYNTFGWAPQGFDVPASKPDYLSDEVVWKPGDIETVCHPYNYITMTLNHDCTLEYSQLVLTTKAQEAYGKPNYSTPMWTTAIQTFGVWHRYTAALPLAFRGPLAIYLLDTEEETSVDNGSLPGYLENSIGEGFFSGYYKDPINYFKNTANGQTLLPSYAINVYDGGSVEGMCYGEGSIVHHFTLTETKTQRKFHFNMKSRAAQVQLYSELNPVLPELQGKYYKYHKSFIADGPIAMRQL